MSISKNVKKPGVASTLTILLLLSAYIFTLIYNSNPASPSAKIFLFITMIFLILFLIGFIFFIIGLFGVKEIRNTFSDPLRISVASSLLLACSYLSTVMNGYVAKIYSEIHPITNMFLYLALTFFVFFIISFTTLIVSFSNRYLFSKI